MHEVNDNLCAIRTRIDQVCDRIGRPRGSVTLVGAAKTVEAERLQPYIDAGLQDIGENYVQEGVAKIAALAAVKSVRWHMIGALQTNKARDVVGRFNLIHSVDRASLANAIDKVARAQNIVQGVLLQVNVGDEASKAGCSPQELPNLAELCSTLPNIEVRGLMCLPPYDDDPELVRPYFRQLREARDALLSGPSAVFVSDVERWHLSMGMSHDFEVAIEEGATMVRIGTALFGERSPRARHKQ